MDYYTSCVCWLGLGKQTETKCYRGKYSTFDNDFLFSGLIKMGQMSEMEVGHILSTWTKEHD